MSTSLFDVCVLITASVLLFLGLSVTPLGGEEPSNGACTVSSDCSRTLACVNEKCTDPCSGTCGSKAECVVMNHNPICSCPSGLTGDPFATCSEIKEVKDDETKVVATSLTGSKKPFAYIEQNCEKSTSSCRNFTCVAFSNLTSSIRWVFKECDEERCPENNRTSNTTHNGLQVSSNIEIAKLESGYLYCNVENAEEKQKIAREVVPYNNKDQIFIRLTEDGFYPYLDPDDGFAQVSWSVIGKGYPEPKIYLLINNETVKNSEKYEISKIIYSNVTNMNITVKINDVSEEDVKTQFSLQAVNDFENRIFNLTFNITDFFNLSMSIVTLNSTNATLKCEALSILKTYITWFSGSKQMNATSSSYTNLTTTSYIDVDSKTRDLTCIARNSKKSLNVTQEIDSIEDSMTIFGSEDIAYVDEKTRRIEVDGNVKTINLTCAVSAHNHSNDITLETNEPGASIGSSEIWSTLFTYRRNFTIQAYSATYYCRTPNATQNGTKESITIEIRPRGAPSWQYIAIVALIVLVFVISIYVLFKMRNYQKLQKEMEELNAVGLANFEKGALEHFNPNLTIDDQVDLLPYDKSYEFPVENLKLGEQIGAGAFGVVVKGEAKGVFEDKPTTPVAVKMVNKNTGDVYIRALASELKIMIYLGKHVNVVNLLGACTKNIAKRELLVIVEYCRFGNLKDYLLKHRHTFIDQINAETGRIDFDIGSDVLGSSTSELSYITPSFESSSASALTKTAEEEDQPDQKNHYKGDYQDVNKPVSTKDLLVWSFQIARGMEYLASRKVLHGDLAARNILLTDENVVKICDFGLSKKMYQKDIYKKSGDEMLPVKWMAIEAITDKIFSVQSDVWSFGVVLWEIFSLARTPYPGMEYNESFCEKLLEGYRMKAPHYANHEIYEIMLKCWDGEPMNRPSFTQLAHRIGSILDEKLKEYYIDMNSGYLKMNAQRFNGGNTDYLSMVGAPSFTKYSAPCSYANIVKTLDEDDDDVNTYI